MAQIVTIKPVIMPAQQRPDKSWNVKIRVTFKRRYRIASTNLTAWPKDIDRHGDLKGEVLLSANILVKKMYEAVAELNYFDLERMEVEDVMRWIRSQLKSQKKFSLDFFEYAAKCASRKKDATAKAYTTAVNAFREFIGKDTFDINDFTVTILKDFVASVNSAPKKPGKKALADNPEKKTTPKKRGIAAKMYLSKLSAVYNEAQMEFNDYDSAVLNIPKNPFKNIKVDAERSVARISKDPAFIQKIIDADRSKMPEKTARALDFYLISFALMGANTADLLTMAAPDEEGIITYCRQKTKDRRQDNAEMKVRVEPCIRPLLARYADPDGKLLLKMNFPSNLDTSSDVNGYLRRLFHKWAADNGEEPFTIYSGRHSWATIGRSNSVGLSKSLIDECLAHSTNQLVDVYAEKDWSIIWEANRKVLALFDWSKLK